MAQQTSIEWLIEELSTKHIGFEMYVNSNKEIIQQAKEMHKAETLRFVRTMPRETGVTQEGRSYVQYDAEKHYNETYNK